MTFEMTHSIFGSMKTFTEDNPPEWLVGKEYKWFWDDYVLKLSVGDGIETDFQEIRRIA